MLKILFYKLGWLTKYTIEYNSLIVNSPNKTIDYYDFKFCPEPLLKERALHWLRGKILTCFSDLVYIKSIGDYKYDKQFTY